MKHELAYHDYDQVPVGTIIDGGGIAVVVEKVNNCQAMCRSLLTGEVTKWGNHFRIIDPAELVDQLNRYDRYREYEVPVFVIVRASNAHDAVWMAEDAIEDVEGAYVPKGTEEALS